MSHPSTLILHRYRYGELPDGEVATLRAHLDDCDDCAGRLRAQENHRAAFELAPISDAIRQAAPTPRRRWRWLAALAPVMAALLLVVIPRGGDVSDVADAPRGGDDRFEADGTRAKGSQQHLEVWLKDSGQLLNGADVRPGDQVQFRYRATSGWVSFAGEDASGAVEVYKSLPADASERGWREAPFALTLDSVSGRQIFFAVFTDEKPAARALVEGLSSGRTIPDARVESIRLNKAR